MVVEDKTMENNTMLIQLVEQAACSFNMLNPTDASDVQHLLDVLRQIGQAAGGLDQCPADLRTSLQRKTNETVQALQQILQQEVEDTSKTLDVVSKAIVSLQESIRRMVDPPVQTGPVPAPAPTAAASTAPSTAPSMMQEAAPAAPKAMTISEEDGAVAVGCASVE
jgi:hypothetical protein